MQCEQIQIEMSSAQTLSPSVKQHIETCADCQGVSRFNQEIAQKMKQIDIPNPSTELFDRIRSARPNRRLTLRASTKLVAGFAAAAALTVAFFTLSGGSAEAAYRQMANSLTRAKTVHFSLFSKDAKKVYELWWRPGAWRESAAPDLGGERLKLTANDGVEFYRYQDGAVQKMKEMAPQPTEFTLEAIADRLMDPPAKFESQVVDAQTETITATNKGGWSRIIFRVDRVSHLPLHGQHQSLGNGVWTNDGSFDFEFNKPISDDKFDPKSLVPRP